MNLALCNAIPRDGFVLLALLLILAAVVVEAVAIGHIKSNTAAGEFRDDGQSSRVLGYLAAHPTIYALDEVTALCHSRSDTLTFHCARFAEAYHVTNGLILASFISAVVAWVLCFCVIGRYAPSTLTLLSTVFVAVSLPTALQCAVVGIFFVRVVGNGRRDLERLFALTKVTFHRHFAANLMVAATALMGAALVLVCLRYVITFCATRRLRHNKHPSKREVEAMMKLHLVNDDWMRQKQVLRSHAKSVQVEMQIRKDDETFLEPGAHQHHHNPDPTIRFVRRSSGNSFAGQSAMADFSPATEVPMSEIDVAEPHNRRARVAPNTQERSTFEPMEESDAEL